MSRIATELMFLIALPPVVLAIVAFLTPDPPSYVFISLLSAVILMSIAIARWIMHVSITPLERALNRLGSPPIQPGSLGSLAEQIDALVEQVVHQQVCQQNKFEVSVGNLQKNLQDRENRHSDILNRAHRQKTADEATRLIALSLLKVLVGMTNKANHETTTLQQDVEKITHTVRLLDFVMRQSLQKPFGAGPEQVNVWQFSDEIIGLLDPLCQEKGIALNVLVDADCPVEVELDYRDRALIFLFVLQYLLGLTDEAASHLISIKSSLHLLELHLGPRDCPGPELYNSYLKQLLDDHHEIRENTLRIPLISKNAVLQTSLSGMVGLVICDDEIARESLIVRLRALGVVLGVDFKSDRLQFCLVHNVDSPAFKAIVPYLNPDVKVIVLNSTTLYHRNNWIHLGSPINQQRLLGLLTELRHKSFRADLNVMIIDDDPANRRLLELQLEELDCHVTSVSSSDHAVELYNRDTTDLILLDLPHNPLDAARDLVGLPNAPPIVGLVAHMTNEKQKACIEMGMAQILVKPIRLETLRSLLNQHFTTSQEPTKASANQEQQPALPCHDASRALRQAEDRPEIAHELLQLLMTSLQPEFRKLNKHYAEADLKAMQSGLSRLEDMAKYCGVPRLSSAISELTSLLGGDGASADLLKAALNQLHAEATRLEFWFHDNPNPFGLHKTERHSQTVK